VMRCRWRIGLASGPVVAGVVGSRRFFYGPSGATRSTSHPGWKPLTPSARIQVPEDVYRRLKDDFVLQERGRRSNQGQRRDCGPGISSDAKPGNRIRRRPSRGTSAGWGPDGSRKSPHRDGGFVGKFGHGNHRCTKVIAASVEVDSAIRDFVAQPLASWYTFLPEHSIVHRGCSFSVSTYWSTGCRASLLSRSACTSPAGGRVLSFISGAFSLVLAVLCFRHFRPGLCDSPTGHLDRYRLHLSWCGNIDLGHQRPSPARSWLADLRGFGQPAGRHCDAWVSPWSRLRS